MLTGYYNVTEEITSTMQKRHERKPRMHQWRLLGGRVFKG